MFYKTLTKRKVIYFSILLTVAFIGLSYLNDWSCRINSICTNIVGDAAYYFLLVFIFSLLTYPFSERAFRYWLIFTVFFIPTLLVGSLFTSSETSFFEVNQGSVFLIYSGGMYCILSILTIVSTTIFQAIHKRLQK